MVKKCANPACSVSFLRLGDGRVFLMEVEGDSAIDRSIRTRQLRYAWLCNNCSRTMTVVVEKGQEIKVAALHPSARTAAEASAA